MKILVRHMRIDGSDDTGASRIYTIWPASQEDLPASTSGPWHQERRWLVLDVTDGIAASYIVEGPVTHPEAIRRATEIQTRARKLKPLVQAAQPADSKERCRCGHPLYVHTAHARGNCSECPTNPRTNKSRCRRFKAH